MAQQEGERLLKNANGHLIDVVLGTQRLKLLPAFLERAPRSTQAEVDINPWDDVTFPLGLTRRSDRVKAYVTIIEGCNDHCAFCVVLYTRGHERMRAKADILNDVSEAVASGRPEVQLLGQIVNHYQAPDDPRCDFPQLLAEVHDVPGVQRIRFASPHPRHTGPRLIDAIRDLPKVASTCTCRCSPARRASCGRCAGATPGRTISPCWTGFAPRSPASRCRRT